MTEQARLELVIDASKAKQGAEQAEKSLTGVLNVSGKLVVSMESVDKRLDEIGLSTRAVANQTEFLTRGMSAVALANQRTNETLLRLEQGLSRVALNTQKAASGTRAFTADAERARKSAGGFRAGLDEIGRSAGSLRGALGGLLAGVSGAFVVRDAVQTLADVESSLATVRGVTGLSESSAQFKELVAQARQLGATTRFTAKEAAEGQLYLARAGFDAQEVLSALPATLNLAAAGNLDLGQAADLASNAVTQFNLRAADTPRVVDALVNVSNNANTDIRQLGEALKFAGPIAHGFNIEIEDTVAALGKLGDAGVQSTLAGTGLRGFLSVLATPSSEAEQRLDKLGLRLSDVDVKTRGLIPVLKTLHDANLDVVDAFNIFDRRNASTALILSQAADGVKELVDIERENIGVAQRLAHIQNDTLRGSLLALRSALQETYLAAGDDGLAGGLRSVVDYSTSVLRFLNGTATAADKATTGAEKLSRVVEGLTKGLVAMSAVKLSGSLVGLFSAPAAAATPLAAAGAAIGASVVATVGIVSLLRNNVEKLASESERIRDAAQSIDDIRRQIGFSEAQLGRAENDTERESAIRQQISAYDAILGRIKDAQLKRDQLETYLRTGVPLTDSDRSVLATTFDTFRADDVASLLSPEQAAEIYDKTLATLKDAFRAGGGADTDIAGFLDFASRDKTGAIAAQGLSVLDIVARLSGITVEELNTPPKVGRGLLTQLFDYIAEKTGGSRTLPIRTPIDVDAVADFFDSKSGAQYEDSDLERGRRFAIRTAQENAAARGITSIRDVDSGALRDAGFGFSVVSQQASLDALLKNREELAGRAKAIDDKLKPSEASSALQERLKDLGDGIKGALDGLSAKNLTELERAQKTIDELFKSASANGLSKDDEATIRAKVVDPILDLAKALDDLKSKTAEKAKADELSKRSLEERVRSERELQSILQASYAQAQPTEEARKKANEQIRLGAEFERVLVLNAKLGLPVWSDQVKSWIRNTEAALNLADATKKVGDELENIKRIGPVNQLFGSSGTGIFEDRDLTDQELGNLVNMLSSAGEAFTRAQRDKEAFFGSFQDDRAFLGAQIDATLGGRPDQAELVRDSILAHRELNQILAETGELETEAGAAAIQRLDAELVAVGNLREELRRVEESRRLFDDIGTAGAQGIADFASGVKDAKTAVADLISELGRLAIQQFFVKPAANFIGNGLAGLFGSSLIPSANGNAFDGGRVIPFATGGVIDSPIRFQLAGGYTGLAGEAGPEAIMPLVRGSNGKLGVHAINSGNSSITNNYISIRGGRGGGGARNGMQRSDRQLASDIARRLRVGA